MNDFLVLRPGQTVWLGSVTKEALAAGMRTYLPEFSAHPDPFLIVEGNAERFVQLWANGPDAFHVEYIEARQPFEHPDGDRTLEETVAIFERFADGVWPPFEGGVRLEREQKPHKRTFSAQALLFLLLLLLLILAYIFG